MRFVLLLMLILGGTSVAAQQAAKSPEISITLPPSLARVLTDYERSWKAGDAAALAQLFTEDGFVLSPGQPPVKGRVVIQKLYTDPGSPLSLRAFSGGGSETAQNLDPASVERPQSRGNRHDPKRRPHVYRGRSTGGPNHHR